MLFDKKSKHFPLFLVVFKLLFQTFFFKIAMGNCHKSQGFLVIQFFMAKSPAEIYFLA